MSQSERILGIDPGTLVMGFGVVDRVGSQLKLVDLGSVKFQASKDSVQRLGDILKAVEQLLDQFQPNSLAVEAPFFGKNVQSMLKLGRAQGVAMAAGLSRDIPITEYEPKKIKMAITGNGNASKEQVAKMLQQLLGLKELPKNLDSTDGLAAAVCHFFNSGKVTVGKNYSGWDAFVKQNENRVTK